MSHFTNVKKNLYVKGIYSYTQYMINNKFFTVVGEMHGKSRADCLASPSTVLENLVESSFDRSSKLRALLEYPPSKALENVRYESVNMVAIKDIVLEKGYDGRVDGFDIRRQYIRSDILYTNRVFECSLERFFKMFWEPLAKNMSHIFSVEWSQYDTRNREYLQTYATSKTDNIKWFSHNVLHQLSDKWGMLFEETNFMIEKDLTILDFFRQIWADAADFYLLSKILQKGDAEYLVLMGESHAKNFYDIFESYSKFRARYDSKTLCVNINGAWLPVS